MVRFYASEYREKVKNLIVLLLPMIASELSIFGMNFFDASMSGQAGPVELAGTAMAGNIWMALNAGMGTALMAGTPIISQLFGAKKFDEIYTSDLESRVEGIGVDRYLAQEFYKERPDENYRNPREFANAHPRLVYMYLTMYNKSTKQPIYFMLDHGRVVKNPNIFKQQALTIDGYNMEKVDVLLVPKKKIAVPDLDKITYDYADSKLFKDRKNKKKEAIVVGYKLPVTDRTKTTVTVDLDVKFTGECDIIVCDNVDYDSISDLLEIESIQL